MLYTQGEEYATALYIEDTISQTGKIHFRIYTTDLIFDGNLEVESGSLDQVNKSQVIDLLEGIQSSSKTIVIVTHDEPVAAVCDRVIGIQK